MERIFYLLTAYFFGLIQTGYFVSKILGVDLSKKGSGNTGATNSLRVMGKKIGIIVFLGDFLKALIPCLAVRFLNVNNENMYIYLLYTGLGVVVGHVYPFYLKFKGGKGVASIAGILCALDLRITLICFIIFTLTVYISRYVSLASILVMLCFSISATLFSNNIIFNYNMSGNVRLEFLILVYAIALLSIFKHSGNIKRLLKGKENKIF